MKTKTWMGMVASFALLVAWAGCASEEAPSGDDEGDGGGGGTATGTMTGTGTGTSTGTQTGSSTGTTTGTTTGTMTGTMTGTATGGTPITDDCVCADCANDAFCQDPANCNMDGVCNPYGEGCGCADCADHPECGGAGVAMCFDIATLSPQVDFPPCDAPDQAACLCEGCVDDGICFDSGQ